METLELNDERNAVEVLKAIQACIRVGIEVKLAIDGKLMARVVAGAVAPVAVVTEEPVVVAEEPAVVAEAPAKTKAK